MREGFDPAFVDVLEVLSRDGADLRCQTGSSHLRDLIGVDLRNESMLFAFFEHATGLLEGEGRVFAEHVAEYREAFLRDAPHELVAHHEVDIGLAAITIFGRQCMRGQIGPDELDRLKLAQPPHRFEHLDLVVQGEAITALDLHRGNAVREHARETRERELNELVEARIAHGLNRSLNPATRLGDLEIALPGASMDELVFPRPREDEMRMRVDEPGNDGTAARVECVAVMLRRPTLSERNDPVAIDRQVSVAKRCLRQKKLADVLDNQHQALPTGH